MCLHLGYNLKISFNFECKKVKLHTTSFNFQNSLQESPWKLMATSGLWALVSWEMELQPNQHGAWIAFGATCIGVKNENNYILYLMNLIHGNIYTSII